MGCSSSAQPKKPDTKPEGPMPNLQKDRKDANSQNKEYQMKMDFLFRVPLMRRLPKDQLPFLAEACTIKDLVKGSCVINQGDMGDEFFVIRRGEASVHVKDEVGSDKNLVRLKPGDYFGETALLRDETRTATIIAETALSVFSITRDKFRELGLNEKLQFANRRAVGIGKSLSVDKAREHEPTPKTPEEVELIKEALLNNDNLQTITILNEERISSFIAVMWKDSVKAGVEIIKEGDLHADYFYIVADGEFAIHNRGDEDQSANECEDHVIAGKGGSFGELALLYFVPRAATVVAKVDSTVFVIDRKHFKDILMKVSESKTRDYEKYLRRVPVLQVLLAEEISELAKALVEMHFTKEEVVIQQGEPGNTFYIMYDGEVSVTKAGEEVAKLSASSTAGTAQYFGETALLHDENRAATVQVTSSCAKTLALDRDGFDMLLGPLKDIIEASKNGQTRTVVPIKGMPTQAVVDGAREKVLRKDLRNLGLLGCGGFGAVELVEHKGTQETYAMKALSKGYIVKTGMQDSVMNEKNILCMTKSAFVIKLFETYNGSQTLYFLLEPALGGEVYATYNRKGFHGSEKHAKFYVAGTVLAFEHLHERRIIYRDLKPENLMLVQSGFVKLTDMGLAKFVIGKTFTTCGTPDYFAPELIESAGHTRAVDWWTLGILVFELMSGRPPFESSNPMQTYSNVKKGIDKVPFPAKCQGVAGEFIKGLLQKEPEIRLPMRPGGLSNLKKHGWFANFDWQAMTELALEPPYKPFVKNKKDMTNFSARKEDMPKQLEYVDPGTGWDQNFASA